MRPPVKEVKIVRFWPPPRPTLYSISSNVDLQTSSPLYNGRVPPELRDMIFAYAMAESSAVPDWITGQEKHPKYWVRPEYTNRKCVFTGLLRACKRTYLENRHLPPINLTHIFWFNRGPPGICRTLPFQYFGRFTPHQRAQAKTVHLCMQQYVQQSRLLDIARDHFLQHVEKLKLTIRRSDWWGWENNNSLGMSPYNGSGKPSLMTQEWKLLEEGLEPTMSDDSWGRAFFQMDNLKELEFELEVSEDKEKELKAIVEHAVKWKFPMPMGGYLTAAGQKVECKRWRGPMCNFSACDACLGPPREDCKRCAEMEILKSANLGPMLVIMTIRFKLVPGGDFHLANLFGQY